MNSLLKSVWTDYVEPLVSRPDRVQVAAACWRMGPNGKEVLLVTSRETKRWILPKGWPIDGLSGAGSALQEAWEEAGVKKAKAAEDAIGHYRYEKGLAGGNHVTCTAYVYDVEVVDLADIYPEHDERERKWVTPKEAATLVNEPELQELLAEF